MEKMNEAQLALQLIEQGKNPIDNYEIVKKSLLTGNNDEVEKFYYMISGEIMDELKKDKECKGRLKDFDKFIKDKLGIAKKDRIFKFTHYGEYETWKEKLKKPIKYDARRTIFLYEVLMPLLDEGFDSLFETFNKRGENIIVGRTVTACNKCPGNLVYSARKEKFYCTQCNNGLTKKELETPTKTESVESVGIDFTQLPTTEDCMYGWAKFFDTVIDVHIKKEKAEWKKELKEKE